MKLSRRYLLDAAGYVNAREFCRSPEEFENARFLPYPCSIADMDVRYIHNPDLAWRVIDDEVVILKIKTTTYYSLDPVGSFIWRKMEEGARSRNEIAASVEAEFEVDGATALGDIVELFSDLVREELLLEQAA